ncbi:hypothetical protein AB0392_40815 [Nonomuraea angiospora]|uniref:hypothetical protein n=1 Tax=Nonomuraea angiospora TaxID=46172 RepID=UPI00344DD877
MSSYGLPAGAEPMPRRRMVSPAPFARLNHKSRISRCLSCERALINSLRRKAVETPNPSIV